MVGLKLGHKMGILPSRRSVCRNTRGRITLSPKSSPVWHRGVNYQLMELMWYGENIYVRGINLQGVI
jgi:hypothetical protein